MFCISCDYPLAGLSSRCPECGRPFDPNDPNTFAAQFRKTRRSQTLSRVLSVISAVFGTVSLALGLGAYLAVLTRSSTGDEKFIDPFMDLLWILGMVALPPCWLIAFFTAAVGAMIDRKKLDRKKVRPILVFAYIAAAVGLVLLLMTWSL